MAVSTKPFSEDWMTEYFAMVDTLDPNELVEWYNDDAEFRFANEPPTKSKAEIIAALTKFYALIKSMHHENTGRWAKADSGVFEAMAHFETKDGRKVVIPAVSTLRIVNGKIQHFLFAMDATPVMQAPK
jgi:ketosteroid isomerase-like protein